MADIRKPDFATELIRSAVLAPSSHNTQPWHFTVKGQTISLYADRTRALPVNDPEDRELTISCGCALNCKNVPDPSDEDLLAVVQLEGNGQAPGSEAELYPSVEKRRTYRKRFESRSMPSAVLQELCVTTAMEGCWLVIVDVEEQRREVATLVSEGDAIQWSNPSWRRELAAWMHPRRQGDGLTLPGLVAPIAKMVIRTFDMGSGVGAKDEQLANESPVLAVLGTDSDSTVDWLNSGQALQRTLLKACGSGLQASYLNQPIQVSSLRLRLQHLLGRTGFPQILLRIGFPTDDLPAAPRRIVDDVIEYK
jgi:hypothetical protein